MPVKSRSKTFKPGDWYEDVVKFFHKEVNDAIEEIDLEEHVEVKVKKRLIITITYDRDDKTE